MHVENFVNVIRILQRMYIISLIFLGINLLSLSTTLFWFQPKLGLASQQCFSISLFSFPDRFFVFIWMQFSRLLKFTKVDCFGVTTVNFINDIDFIFCSYSFCWFTKTFMESAFSVESGSYFVRSEYMS